MACSIIPAAMLSNGNDKSVDIASSNLGKSVTEKILTLLKEEARAWKKKRRSVKKFKNDIASNLTPDHPSPFKIKTEGRDDSGLAGPEVVEAFQRMMTESSVQFPMNAAEVSNMFEYIYVGQKSAIESYVYTKEEMKTYREMKLILEEEEEGEKSLNVCRLIDESGAGETEFLRQFCRDKDIDLVYIAAQHSYCEDGRRKLNLANNTMTFFRLMMILFSLGPRECELLLKHLQTIPLERIISMGLPAMFTPANDALKKLLKRVDLERSGNKKLILCVDHCNIIHTNELYMLKSMLEKIVSSASNGRKVMLLLSGHPKKIQPLSVQESTENKKCLEGVSAEEGADAGAAGQSLPENAVASIQLADFHFTLNQGTSNFDELTEILCNFRNVPRSDKSLMKFFAHVAEVREISYEYPIRELLLLPNRKDYPGGSSDAYAADVTDWVKRNRDKFNSFNSYSQRNDENHYVNILTTISVWQQCQKFNKSPRPFRGIPANLMPRVAQIFFANKKGEAFRGISNEMLPRRAVLPLIIGANYKVLHSAGKVTRGQIVTLVHIEYEDPPETESFRNIKNLEVVSDRGDLIAVNPGYFTMGLYCSKWNRHRRFRYEKEVVTPSVTSTSPVTVEATPSDKSKYLLYGFPLQLAFAKTIRGSLGPPIKGDVYARVTNFSFEEVFTLLSEIRDPNRVKGFAHC